MIVDVHSHYWEYPKHFTADFETQAKRAWGGQIRDLTVRWNEYYAGATECDKTVVFGGKAKLSGLWVPDWEVAAYAAQHPDHLIPFLSVDPTQPGWQDELIAGHQDLKMNGVKLLPMYAGFRMDDGRLDPICLKNLRLWQLMLTCGMAARSPRLLPSPRYTG